MGDGLSHMCPYSSAIFHFGYNGSAGLPFHLQTHQTISVFLMGALVSSNSVHNSANHTRSTKKRTSPPKGIMMGNESSQKGLESSTPHTETSAEGQDTTIQNVENHHQSHHIKSASKQSEKSTSKSSSAGHSKRRSRKKHQTSVVPDLQTSSDYQQPDNENPEKMDHDGTASVSDTSHAWLSEALTEDRESSEEMIRSLKMQLLTAQQERDCVRSELDAVINRAAAEKGRLDRMLMVAAKETARVEDEKMKILMEFTTFKDKVVEEKAAYEAEKRRLKAELAMSNRHEGNSAHTLILCIKLLIQSAPVQSFLLDSWRSSVRLRRLDCRCSSSEAQRN